MACLLVPAAEAIVASVTSALLCSREEKSAHAHLSDSVPHDTQKIPFSRKLRWLSAMQFGGALLLAFEHVWHGEIVPYFPFLTAAADASGLSAMLHEMATVGVGMAALTTAVWGAMLVFVHALEKKSRRAQSETLS